MKDLINIVSENTLNYVFYYLPEGLKTFFSITFCLFIALIMLIYLLNLGKPLCKSFYAFIKQVNSVQASNITLLDSKQYNEIYSKEKEIADVMRITKCKNRRLSLFFSRLTIITKNKISPSHFKKLYSHLVIEDNEIKLCNKTILVDNIFNASFAILFFTLALLFLHLCLFCKPLSMIQTPILCVVIIILAVQALYFYNLIIRKKEKEDFLEIKNNYFKKLLPSLKI